MRSLAMCAELIVGIALLVGAPCAAAETVAGTAHAVALFVRRVAAQVQDPAKEWAQCHYAAYNESEAV
jgi:hypothetical protein